MTVDVPESTVVRWRKLIERLAYNSSNGKLDWEEGVLPSAIVTSILDVVITLQRKEFGSRVDYVIQISDISGAVIDAFTDEQVPNVSSGQSSFVVMDNIYRSAKRKITGADDILDQILASLPEEPDEIPF